MRREAEKRESELEAELEKERRKVHELEKSGLSDISTFLRDARKTLENLISDIQTGKLDKAKIKKAKDFMQNVQKKEADVRSRVAKSEEEEEEDMTFTPGESVLCGKSRIKGQILEKSGKSYLVLLSSGLKLRLKASDLESFDQKKEISLPSFSKLSRKAEYEMDLRGLSGDMAIERLEDQMEAAILSSLKSFSIIHGLGDGILMHRVHDYLKTRSEVESYYFARPEDGGMGKTYVKLR